MSSLKFDDGFLMPQRGVFPRGGGGSLPSASLRARSSVCPALPSASVPPVSPRRARTGEYMDVWVCNVWVLVKPPRRAFVLHGYVLLLLRERAPGSLPQCPQSRWALLSTSERWGRGCRVRAGADRRGAEAILEARPLVQRETAALKLVCPAASPNLRCVPGYPMAECPKFGSHVLPGQKMDEIFPRSGEPKTIKG